MKRITCNLCYGLESVCRVDKERRCGMIVENGKVCCNCRHCKRITKEHGKRIECRCDWDNAYLTYTTVLSYWCQHWTKDKKGGAE